jgi:hypothetical protein
MPQCLVKPRFDKDAIQYLIQVMLRRVATALLILAVLLLGYRPQANAMLVAMTMEQSCCNDCDKPAMPDGGCLMMAGCVTAAPLAVPSAPSLPIRFSVKAQRSFQEPIGLASIDTTPPFRPPCP